MGVALSFLDINSMPRKIDRISGGYSSLSKFGMEDTSCSFDKFLIICYSLDSVSHYLYDLGQVL